MLQEKERKLIENLLANASERQADELYCNAHHFAFSKKYRISFSYFKSYWLDEEKKRYCTITDPIINGKTEYIFPNPIVEKEFYSSCYFGIITKDLAESIVTRTEGRFKIRNYEIVSEKERQAGIVMSRRESLGFKKGFITLLQGDQSLYEEWLRADAVCRYHGHFKWFIPSQCEVPQDLPKGLEPVTISINEVFQDNSDELLSWDVIDARIAELLYGDSPSAHYGTIGTRYDLELTILNITTTTGAYGNKYFYLFVDADGNEFTWSTSTSKDLSPHSTYTCRGTVKAHNVYKGRKQTELTRVMGFKPVES